MNLTLTRHNLCNEAATDGGPGPGAAPAATEPSAVDWVDLSAPTPDAGAAGEFDAGDGGSGGESPDGAGKGGVVAPTTPAAAPAAQPPAAPTEPAAPAPATASVQPTAPATTVQPPAAPAAQTPAPATETQPPAAPAATESAPGPTADQMRQQRESFVSMLEQQYMITEEDADSFVTDPRTILAKLAANLHVNITEAVTYGLSNLLPQMVGQQLTVRTREEAAEADFFSAWPKLNNEAGRATVQQLGRAWRATNPGAKPEEFKRAVGAMAMVALQLPLDELMGQAPSAPAVQTPPPAPAAPGGAAPLPAKAGPTNIFSQFAEEFIAEG